MNLEVYALIIGIVLCVLGILMIIGQLNFLIARYEAFQNFIRKREFSVDKEGLSKYYSILFFVSGIPLLIVAIIGFINSDIFELISIWIYIALATIGIIGILYCNISSRFLKPLENVSESSFQE